MNNSNQNFSKTENPSYGNQQSEQGQTNVDQPYQNEQSENIGQNAERDSQSARDTSGGKQSGNNQYDNPQLDSQIGNRQ